MVAKFIFLIGLIFLDIFGSPSFILVISIAALIALFILNTWLLRKLRKEKRHVEKFENEILALSEAGKSIKLEYDKSEAGRLFLANAIPAIVWEADENGHIHYFNQQWHQYTGIAVEESLGDGWTKALHGDEKPGMIQTWRKGIAAGEEYQAECHLRSSNGEFRWFLAKGAPMKNKDGKVVKWFGTFTDIEDQKNQRIILEERIRERTLQLQRLNEELSRSNKELENFAYVASHDLQEPLRKIRAFGDILIRKHGQNLSEQGHEYVARMQKASYRMQILIDDLLNYSRVSRNPTISERVSLNELLNEALDDLEQSINEKKAVIRCDTLPEINGDRRQLKQLFQNLISNGIKFHKTGEPPVIEIRQRIVHHDGKSRKRRNLELVFADNGIGFDEKYHEKIFTIFQRLHGRNEFEGTGIGLAICKKIVENHSGKIFAKSAPGSGSEFFVVLPLQNEN